MKKAEANVMRGMFLTKTKTESFKQTEFRTIIFYVAEIKYVVPIHPQQIL